MIIGIISLDGCPHISLRMCPIEACPHHFSADVEIPKSMLFDILPLRSVAVPYVDFMVYYWFLHSPYCIGWTGLVCCSECILYMHSDVEWSNIMWIYSWVADYFIKVQRILSNRPGDVLSCL